MQIILKPNKIYCQLIVSCIMVLLSIKASATHYRAGEIIYEQLTERRYRITAITYTDPRSRADISTEELTISFGDGTSETVKRTNRVFLSNIIVQNIYTTTHEYRIDGSYLINIIDQNRVDGIVNINLGNSQYIAFYVESLLKINQSIGPNRSPILTKPPIDNGCLNRRYYHNPSAYDPDGDSLVFSLIPPKQAMGQEVPNYETPKSSNDIFKIDPINGQLEWDAPILAGIYNIAILIREYRKNILVGYVVRDMQITINNCINQPPVVQNIANGCVVVGDTIQRIISAADLDNFQKVSLRGYGGPFAVERKATYSPNPAIGLGSINTLFNWSPSCSHIRKSPWQIIFEAKDDEASNPAVNQNSFFVQVIAPPILNVKTTQINNGFELTWNNDTCGLAGRYKVYRKIDSSNWQPAHCETGIPASTGFQLIHTVNTLNNPTANVFYDNNGGSGLSPLVTYCYRVIAEYPPRSASGQVIYGDFSESIASEEVCAKIVLSTPMITKASVISTHKTNGKTDIAFIKPEFLDTVHYQAPYQVAVKRNSSKGINFTTIATKDYTSFANINDEVLQDSMLNTSDSQYVYVIDFYATVSGAKTLVGTSPNATTIRTGIYSTDRTNILSWNVNVPWHNDTFIVYRKNTSNVFDSIGFSLHTSYSDTNLTNNQTYCYLIRSSGFYESFSVKKATFNFSQEICGTPIDTVKPCAPALSILPPCSTANEYRNYLSWTPIPQCAMDVVSYKVFFKPMENDPYQELITLPNTQLNYWDMRTEQKQSIAGCYYVAGVDSAGNISNNTNEVCVDNCPFYQIPNVFTPNGDLSNDTLHPFPYRFVSAINMVIYNRWGIEVYSTTDIDINWNGADKKTGNACPDGVYYYICEVKETYLDGVKTRNLQGTIQIIRN